MPLFLFYCILSLQLLRPALLLPRSLKTLRLSFTQLLWGWTICNPQTPAFSLRHMLWCLCYANKDFSCTEQLQNEVSVVRKIHTPSWHNFSELDEKFNRMLCCSWSIWLVAVALPSHLPPDFMREKWTQTVAGSLIFLYTYRLLRPHNCVIQVACQSCERSSQPLVDVGLIYIVEGETKTAQPKWNIWIVLSCQKGLCHTGHSVPILFPQRSQPYSVCSANFGGMVGWSALWLCFMVTF